ncbi:PREDICTED: centrosome-associated protein CEP250, partial [Merops nubicus]|uniref:centrosome-associated protein CEP250 n=1 Tax=Merops nubicus TaxID=57421 RepID=UPI0004F01674
LLQYRTWCQELEQQLEAGGVSAQGSLPGRQEATEDHSLEKALLQLEEEQQRCENLAEVNALLRDHLDKAKEVNSALKEDVGKLTADWMRAREELELKESEWHNERELYDSYVRGERDRLLSLWRQVVTFRRHFLEMKTATDRDLSELRAEQMRLSGSILVNCSHLNSGLQLWGSVTRGRCVLMDQAQQQAGEKINQKTQEIIYLQGQEDLEKKELQDRVMELSALLAQSQKQNEEKEKTMKTLNDTVEILETSQSVREYEALLTRSAKEENLSLQKLIKDITEMVLDDSDSTISVTTTGSSQHAESGNILSDLGSADAKHAFGLVQEALARRRGATQALKEELSARQDSVNILLHQHRQQEEKCRKLQQRLDQLEEECKTSSSHRQHLQSLVEALRSDCADMEQSRAELQQQLEGAQQEASRLRQSNTELQLKEDSAQEEKVEQQKTMERARHEQELLLKDLAALEEKHSMLQSELVVTRETLEESYLQRDLLKQEKHELTVALEKAEQAVADLTGAQNKLGAEIADLRDATEKMSSINEALALDKVQLNKIALQLEQENGVLSGKVAEMERARISDLEKLNFCEKANEDLCAEKAHLEQLLKKAEEEQEGLQIELMIMAEEKTETQEKLNQVSRQQEAASSDLEQLQEESSRQGHALARVSREQEFLVHEKAALEVRLAAVERDRESLSEQLAEARSVKETLESSLFEAQQHVSQLEITRSQLEIQLHTVTQAKEVIQGEVKCLQCELEAERSLMKQERETMAQQLLQTELQYDNTLRLRETDHEMERTSLLQDLASEQERHRSELQQMLEQWEKEKAETEGEHEEKLFDMKQKVATMQAQQEEEQTRVENAKQEVLMEKEREKNALLETLLQTQGELREASQQLEQLRQEVKEQQENGQNITEKLQAELQEAWSKIKAVEDRHREEIETVKEEMNILLQQRDALQTQVEELTSQLAASEESKQVIDCKAQQDLSEAQELSKQKVLEIVHLQKMLEETRSQWEEVQHQNKELQVCLQSLEGERSRWEEVERQNAEFQALLKVLESEKARLTLSLEEKELSLRTLEENNLAQHNEMSQLLSAIHQAQQLHSDHRREIQELNNQVQSLQDVVLEKEAGLAAREEQLLQDLEESRAGEQHLRGSLHVLEAEVSELHLRLCNTESRAEALATECQQANSAHSEAQSQLESLRLALHHIICDSRDFITWSSGQGDGKGVTVSQAWDLPAELTVDRVAAALQDLQQHLQQTQQDLNDAREKIQDLELELSKRQDERDHFSAHNQELQKQLAQSQEETQMAEHKKSSLQAALQEEAAALKEEAMTLHQEVASLERKLESTEVQRREALRERDGLRAVKEKLVQEIKLLQQSVTASETQANTATDMTHSLEQELQATLSILKMKNEEVEMLQEKIQMLQKEAAEAKALQENLTQMTAILSEREGQMKLYQEQMRMLEEEKEMHKTTLDQVIKDITEKKQKTESQQEHIQELEKQREKQRTAVSKMSRELEERDQEIRSQQEQIQELEKQRELQGTAVSRMSRELEQRDQEIRSQQEQIQELEKQRELQRTAVSKMSRELEQRDQEIRSQQEQIQELEKQQELQRTAVSKMSRELEERDQEIKYQEGKIMGLENHHTSQMRNLLVDLDCMKENLKEKDIELMSLTQQIQELEKEREQVKSLHASLEHLRAVLKDRESECDSQRDQLRLLQQYKEQQEGHLQELNDKVEKMRHSFSEKDQELESQKKHLQDAEEVKGMQLRTVHDQLEQTLEALKEKDTLLDTQKQQTWNNEEKTEEWVNVLHKDFRYSKALLNEKDLVTESQKEVLETSQKQDSEQQKEILQHLQGALKEQEQEMLSLGKQFKSSKEKEEEHEAEQTNFQAKKQSRKEKEVEVLGEAISKPQQKEVAGMQTEAILQNSESSLEARDQEIVSLQEPVQDLREQELEDKQGMSLQQDQAKTSQIVKKNHLEFLRETEQMSIFQLHEESMKVALTSCQKQVNLLEEEVRKRNEEIEALVQKLQCQEEELKTLQNLQLRVPKKNEEVEHHRGQETLLEETLPGTERETKTQGEQKELEEEIRALREDLQHVKQTLTKKDEEIKYQRDRVRYLEKTLTGREQEFRRKSELLKQLTSASWWKDGGETLQQQIQKLQKWEEEEAEKRKVLQERDHLLKRQKELTHQLEEERKAKAEELEHVIAILKQTESGEIEWKEKAQALTLALTKSEVANGTLREEITILQSMVSERDRDRFHLQQAAAEGEQLSWLSERRLLLQRLERLQQAVARLELEKMELKQLNAEFRRTLERVECERRRLKRYCSGQSVPDACGFSLSKSDLHKMPASKQEKSHGHCSRQVAELQNQVSLLQTQLAQERKHKRDYIECCAKTSQELADLHQELSYSLAAVVREPKAAVLEAETRKLDRSLNLNLALMSLDHQSPERQPLHSTARSIRSNDLS